MEDIAPGVLETIRKSFAENIESSKGIAALYAKIEGGTAVYADAEEYARLVGEALSQAFGSNLSSSILPDGKLYYNIAERVVRPLMEEDHSIVSNAAEMVQASLNQKAGIGLSVQHAPVNTDRIDGLIDKVSNADGFDDAAHFLGDPIVNFSQNVVDETLRRNVNFQGKVGRHPRIIRKAERKCCKWCSALAGEYEYPDVPDDVYRRHENCNCTVEYDPGDGSRQNVHTKRWTEPGQHDKIEERKGKNLSDLGRFNVNSYDRTIQEYVSVDQSQVVKDALAGTRHAGVYMDAVSKTKKQLQKSIISRTAEVERHAEKIKHPERYVKDWDSQDIRYRNGLLKKWEKDMLRNAEQAEIEIALFERRFKQ